MCVHNHIHISAHYFKPIDISGVVSTCLNPSPVAERGANVYPGKVAERCKNVSIGAVLKDRFARGIATDRFPQVKKCTAEPAAILKGDVCVGASTVVRGRILPGSNGRPFCLLNTIFSIWAAPMIRPLDAIYIIYFEQ